MYGKLSLVFIILIAIVFTIVLQSIIRIAQIEKFRKDISQEISLFKSSSSSTAKAQALVALVNKSEQAKYFSKHQPWLAMSFLQASADDEKCGQLYDIIINPAVYLGNIKAYYAEFGAEWPSDGALINAVVGGALREFVMLGCAL